MTPQPCGRYGCDGRHFLVGVYRNPRTDVLEMVRDLLDYADERDFLEDTEPPNGWRAGTEVKRCPDCNPEPAEAVKEAEQITQEATDAPHDRVWWGDKDEE